MEKIRPKIKGIQQFTQSRVPRNVFDGRVGCAPVDPSHTQLDQHTENLLKLQQNKKQELKRDRRATSKAKDKGDSNGPTYIEIGESIMDADNKKK